MNRRRHKTDLRLTTKWAKSADFAEIAEALKINTDQVVGIAEKDGLVTAIYSRAGDEQNWPPVFSVALKRDLDGVLFVASEVHEIEGFWDDLKASLEK